MIAANITVFECDECHAVVSVKNEAEFQIFETTWHTGLLNDFCPGCRFKIKVQARILKDESMIARAAQKMNAEVSNA